MDRRDFGAKSPPVKRPPSQRRHQHRSDLVAAAVRKHGLPAVEVLLKLVEAEAGDLHVDARLRRLIDLDAIAFANALALVSGRPPL